jgi:DNA polymerase III delta prime subunit
MVQELFTEKFRPKTLDHMILPKRIMDFVKGGELHQNVLFYGPPGLGKTSLAKVLTQKYPTLYINVSDESSVDVIRDRIKTWCSTSSILDGKQSIKVVLLDEMDGASDQFYKALRATIEKFAHLARFVGTCNYINKVPAPIQSRFELVSFDFINKEEEGEVFNKVAARSLGIIKRAGITIDKPALIEFIKRNFPDMRKILNKIQSWYIQGITEIKLEDIRQLNYSYSDIFQLACGKPNAYENYKFLVANYSSKVDEVLASMGTEFPEYIKENHTSQIGKLPLLIIEVAQHQAQRNHVIDPIITMLSLIFKSQTILNS